MLRIPRFTHHRCAIPGLALGCILAAAALCAGCGSTSLPCMQYQPQLVTRIVTMRGQGPVQITEQAMVCTHRASSMEEGLIGP